MSRWILCFVLVAGCGQQGRPWRPEPTDPEPPPPFECDAEATPPAAESLQWKRVAALTADLERALGLEGEELCSEVGTFACEDVHIVTLGGNDPFALAQYEPVASPLATTPPTVDRVVLGACTNAVERDAATSPVVFTELPPTAEAPERAAIDAQATVLYRRLLSRDPEPAELDLVAELALDDVGVPRSAREVDLLACFAIGTTSEMILF